MRDIAPYQEKAHEYYQKAVQLVSRQRGLFIELGEVLYTIKKEKLYRHMGEGGFDTFQQFCANAEIDISPNTADAYLRVYEYYCLKLNYPKKELKQIPVNRLNMMMGKVKEAKDKDDMLGKAKELSYTDFLKEVMGKKFKDEQWGVETYKCPQCGKLVITYNQDNICMCDGVHAIYTMPSKKRL